MATNDAFSDQIVELVRKMPAEAILALVKNQLGAVTAAAAPLQAAVRRRGRPPRAAAAAAPAPAASAPAAKQASSSSKRGAAPKRKPGRPRRSPAASQERQDTLNNVERIVKQSQGVSASDVAKSAGIPQTRAAAALKELKLAKRIFQGGDRRFARYAGDAKAAEQASLNARKNASGPAAATGKKTAAKGGRKRASAQTTPATK
jgi:hypothetical protein